MLLKELDLYYVNSRTPATGPIHHGLNLAPAGCCRHHETVDRLWTQSIVPIYPLTSCREIFSGVFLRMFIQSGIPGLGDHTASENLLVFSLVLYDGGEEEGEKVLKCFNSRERWIEGSASNESSLDQWVGSQVKAKVPAGGLYGIIWYTCSWLYFYLCMYIWSDKAWDAELNLGSA